MYANFLLGTLAVTEAAAARLGRIPLDLIARHAVNDHGLLSREEALCNMRAMKTMGYIKSRYSVNPLDPSAGNVIVETSAGWAGTLAKLEEEEA